MKNQTLIRFQVKDGLTIKEVFDLGCSFEDFEHGEMLKSSSKGTFKKGGETALPSGITKKDSHYAQELSRNIEVLVEELQNHCQKIQLWLNGKNR